MNTIYIQNSNDFYFQEAWDIYEESFPKEEKRTLQEQIKLLEKDTYTMAGHIENNTLVSILFYWRIDSYTYLEHFAINSKLRGQNYGSKILKQFILKNENIILEIEPIIDEMTQKRLSFYEKFNFVVNQHIHFQVPFRENSEDLKLLLLTQNSVLSKDEYLCFYKKLQNELSSNNQ